jgi:hypothetical protein
VPTQQLIVVRGLNAARRRLSWFALMQAHQTANYVGFGWEATDNPPSDYPSLVEAFEYSLESGKPLPISNRFCDRTIYLTPAGNVQMRFWHDVSHVRTGRTFRGSDELQLADYHLRAAVRAGFSRDSLEHRLFYADTMGQAMCQISVGKFPDDQLGFALRCLRYGVSTAVDYELKLLYESQPADAA